MSNFGECEICGKEAELVSVGEIYICDECIDADFVCCDCCEGCFRKEDTVVYYLNNGDIYCEDCALNSSDLTDDDIDHIEYPEGYEEEDEEF